MSVSQAIIKRDDIRGLYPKDLNGDSAEAIGQAVGEMLRARGCQTPVVAIGYDCRHGNLELAHGFALGLSKAGAVGQILGLVSTEHVYFACGEHADRFDAGAMITASHNPAEYNGIKMLYSGCLPFTSDDLKAIGKRVDEIMEARTNNACESMEAQQIGFDFAEYASKVLPLTGLDQRPDTDKKSFRVVVLAGNGMGAVAFRPLARLLEPKGLEAIFLEDAPDGNFPKGVPNPILPEFMERLSKETLAHQADLGIGFDGDADRAGFVDASGKQIIASQVLALIAQGKLERDKREKPVVMRNLCCSQLLRDLFPAGGNVELVDTPVGHGRIKVLMRSEEFRSRVIFAGEHSGHYFYPEFHYVDSGVLTTLNILSIAWNWKENGIRLVDKLEAWRKNYVWTGEKNYDMDTQAQIMNAMRKIDADLEARGYKRREIRVDAATGLQRVFDGAGAYNPEALPAPDLKLVADNGATGTWFVLRPSGNEPKLRLNVEAWGEGAAEAEKALSDAVIAKLLALGARSAN